jgi:hypothetical protein
MPSPPPPMSSPEMSHPPEPGNVDSRTILSSPLADQMSGPMMLQQVQAQEAKMMQGLVMPIIQKIADRKRDTDPKGAAELYAILGKLIKVVPPVAAPPTSPGGMTRAAGALPAGPLLQGGGPPPPVGGTGPPLSGPMPGM